MCHGQALKAFPTPTKPAAYHQHVSGYVWHNPTAENRIAILPDIYGCNPMYSGLATRFHQMGAEVILVDTFAPFGKLKEMTRDLAFERRHTVKDSAFIDRLENFLKHEQITGVIGFCLGGLYVFELARRNVAAKLVGLYGFPQGMPNQDPLPVPFDYLSEVSKKHTMLLGADDDVIGHESIERLRKMAPGHPCLNLKIYDGVGHNFLALLDSEIQAEQEIARDALAICDRQLLDA